MRQERLNQLTSSFLISASQIAYVESASETLTVLEMFADFFRYAVQGGRQETLYAEIEALRKYVLFQQARYKERIALECDQAVSYQSIFIQSMSIIEYFDLLVGKLLDDTMLPVKAVLSLLWADDVPTLRVELTSNQHTSTYTKRLNTNSAAVG